MSYLWGVDLGGTKIEGIIIKDRDIKNPVCRLRVPTEAAKGYDHIVNQIALLINNMKAESGITPAAIGFGTPGTLDPGNATMKNCNTTALNGKPLHKDLEAKLGVKVALANDANCFALAEATLGAVPEKVNNAEVVFGIIMGTGVGGGLVVNGKVINGRHGIAGEWGHNFLNEIGGHCYCGKTGCIETVIAGPALQRHYLHMGGTEELKLPEIYERYKNGDEVAARLINFLLEEFGKAVASLINILDPDAIVIGGGVGNIEELYTIGREHILKHLFNNRLETPILKPLLGDSAGVFGAAMLVA